MILRHKAFAPQWTTHVHYCVLNDSIWEVRQFVYQPPFAAVKTPLCLILARRKRACNKHLAYGNKIRIWVKIDLFNCGVMPLTALGKLMRQTDIFYVGNFVKEVVVAFHCWYAPYLLISLLGTAGLPICVCTLDLRDNFFVEVPASCPPILRFKLPESLFRFQQNVPAFVPLFAFLLKIVTCHLANIAHPQINYNRLKIKQQAAPRDHDSKRPNQKAEPNRTPPHPRH